MAIVHYNRIKEVIEAKGLKQRCVAEQLGCTPRYFYKITNNHVQPSVDKLYKLAQILNVKADICPGTSLSESCNDYISEEERKYKDSIVKLVTGKLGYEYLGKLQYGKDKSSQRDLIPSLRIYNTFLKHCHELSITHLAPEL